MPATSTCKPWCDNHQAPNECYTNRTIWDNGEEEKQAVEPEAGSMAALFQADASMPKDIGWINLIVSQDEDDEQPLLDLHLFESGGDEAVARVWLGANGMKELHSALGAVLKKFA